MRLIGLTLVIATAFSLSAQTTSTSDPQAVSLAAQSMTALTGGSPVNDITLTGNASWNVGVDNAAVAAAFYAKGLSESRVDLTLNGPFRSEIRNSSNFAQGAWIGQDGVLHPYADFNCSTDPAWFFPALSSLSASDPSIVLSYIGQETRFGVTVQHIASFRTGSASSQSQQFSTMNFYLDATSLLPVSLSFNTHPDDNSNASIPVEIRFTNYQAVNGVLVPMHIQQYFQGTLHLDVVVSNATLNSGLQDSFFSLP